MAFFLIICSILSFQNKTTRKTESGRKQKSKQRILRGNEVENLKNFQKEKDKDDGRLVFDTSIEERSKFKIDETEITIEPSKTRSDDFCPA